MTLYHYRLLNDNLQIKIIENEGVLIDERIKYPYKILLYQVDSFYVEKHTHLHFNVIHKIKSFSGTQHLAPYLNKIDISALVA